MSPSSLPVRLVGDGLMVPCIDGVQRPYVSLDAAASTAALPSVADRVRDFLPWYSSVHRGAGWKSQMATAEYEQARVAALTFAGRQDRDDVAIICRNTTEAINHLAYRLPLDAGDVIVTTVVEHHANLLPWARVATRRYVECGRDGTFTVDDVIAALDMAPRPKLLALTGASNVTGWMPPIDAIIDAAHERGVPVFVDAAQLAPHRPLPLHADFVAWSGHKMYAPFGAGVLIGPRETLDRPARARGGRLAQRARRGCAAWRHRGACTHRMGPHHHTRPIDRGAASRRSLGNRTRSHTGRCPRGVAARRQLRHRPRAARARRGPAQRGVRDRCAPRVLLRAPLFAPASRPSTP